jgi:hypothetical protein
MQVAALIGASGKIQKSLEYLITIYFGSLPLDCARPPPDEEEDETYVLLYSCRLLSRHTLVLSLSIWLSFLATQSTAQISFLIRSAPFSATA